jgi:hypothetical protein
VSQFRQWWRVTIDDVEHDIVTNAADVAAMPATGQTMGDMIEMVHRACVRLKVPGCPQSFERFLELLDDANNMEGQTRAVSTEMDPTPATASAG